MLPPHITVTTNNLYKYKRRTPQELKCFISTQFIVRSLGKDEDQAITRGTQLTQVIYEAIQLTQLSSVPSSVIQTLLDNHSLTYLITAINTKGATWDHVTKLYLKQSQVTPVELANRTYFFLTLMPSIFQVLLKTANPELSKLTYDTQLNIRTLLLKLPKKNIHRYRSMNLISLVMGIHQGTLRTP